jgi:cold shock CspA family protein
MRHHGILVRWNEERGFGFIAPDQPGDEIFVHISAFPRDGMRPRIDEALSFEIEQGDVGTKRAIRVQRPGARTSAARSRARATRPVARNPIAAVLGLLVMGAIGVFAYDAISSRQADAGAYSSAAPAPAAVRAAPTVPAAASSRGFDCDGRTHCSQMSSCAEATYFIQHCPGTEMDGDRDGVPCEQQWCQVDSAW